MEIQMSQSRSNFGLLITFALQRRYNRTVITPILWTGFIQFFLWTNTCTICSFVYSPILTENLSEVSDTSLAFLLLIPVRWQEVSWCCTDRLNSCSVTLLYTSNNVGTKPKKEREKLHFKDARLILLLHSKYKLSADTALPVTLNHSL